MENPETRENINPDELYFSFKDEQYWRDMYKSYSDESLEKDLNFHEGRIESKSKSIREVEDEIKEYIERTHEDIERNKYTEEDINKRISSQRMGPLTLLENERRDSESLKKIILDELEVRKREK